MVKRKSFASLIVSPVALALFSLMMLSGCAATESKWTHDEIPAEEWSVDAAQCKWEARRKAERDAEEAIAYESGDAFDDQQSIDSMFAAAEIKKRSRVLFSRCMQSLGYVAVE